MAYDEDLAERIRGLLPDVPVTEQKMFGGLAFLVGGHMAVAASGKGGLMLRCDPADTERLVGEPGASRMEMRGKEMDGWLRVTGDAVADDAALERWVARRHVVRREPAAQVAPSEVASAPNKEHAEPARVRPVRGPRDPRRRGRRPPRRLRC